MSSPRPTDAITDGGARSVGAYIRTLRRRSGQTLVELAGRANLSHSFLSQLERGLTRPSMISLERIALALGTTQSQLLSAAEGSESVGRPRFKRATEGLRGIVGDAEARMLAPGTAFDVIEFRGTNADLGDYYVHQVDELLYVVSGHVLLDLDNHGSSDLGPGDSVSYDAGTRHRWVALHGEEYHLLLIKMRADSSRGSDELN
jgi:transcriptional regulator with XRE-family HTH domain